MGGRIKLLTYHKIRLIAYCIAYLPVDVVSSSSGRCAAQHGPKGAYMYVVGRTPLGVGGSLRVPGEGIWGPLRGPWVALHIESGWDQISP